MGYGEGEEKYLRWARIAQIILRRRLSFDLGEKIGVFLYLSESISKKTYNWADNIICNLRILQHHREKRAFQSKTTLSFKLLEYSFYIISIVHNWRSSRASRTEVKETTSDLIYLMIL